MELFGKASFLLLLVSSIVKVKSGKLTRRGPLLDGDGCPVNNTAFHELFSATIQEMVNVSLGQWSPPTPLFDLNGSVASTLQIIIFSTKSSGISPSSIAFPSSVSNCYIWDIYIYSIIGMLSTWLQPENTTVFVPPMNFDSIYHLSYLDDARYFGYRKRYSDSGLPACKPLYSALFEVISFGAAYSLNRSSYYNQAKELFDDANKTPPHRCHLLVFSESHQWNPVVCGSEPILTLTPSNWQRANTDVGLQAFINGGPDPSGVWWPGRTSFQVNVANETHIDQPFGAQNGLYIDLSSDLGAQLIGNSGFKCSMESPCSAEDLTCTNVGSRTTIGLGSGIYPSIWGYFVLQAFALVNQHLRNQYDALQSAGINGALAAFNIGDFFPKPDAEFSLRNVLAGLGLTLSIFAGVFPIAAPLAPAVGTALAAGGAAAGAGGAILSSISGFIGNDVAASQDPLAVQKTYAPKVMDIYNLMVRKLNELANTLLSGGSGNGFDITTMLQNGTWANPLKVANVSEIERQMRIEILSRSIDALWKTYSSNKMWLVFSQFTEDWEKKCKDDMNGPQDMKHCEDGGVYYAYNFIEDGDHKGHVDYPWGADKLDKLQLTKDVSPATCSRKSPLIVLKMVVQGSVRTYQTAMKLRETNASIDIYSIDNITLTNAFLDEVSRNGLENIEDLPGKYPGSWTLPVCNVSTWGAKWNWNYNNGSHDGKSHPPCICGEYKP